MSLPIMQDQKQVSPYRGLPIDDLGGSVTATIISGETVQLYYNNAGVLTADAGQAAGVAVIGVLAYDYSLDKIQSCLGKFGDTSLSFTSTALTTEVFATPEDFEKTDTMSWKQKLSTLTSALTNGQYVVDYRSGVIYGKKASITTTLTGTSYSIAAGASVMLGNVAGGAADSGAPIKVGGVYNLVRPTYDSGDRTDLQANVNGGVIVQSEAYDTATGTEKNSPSSGPEDRFVPENLVNTTNVASGTIYPSSSGIVLGGYKDLSFSGTLIDGVGETTTLTLEVSNVGGATATDWHQVYFYDNKLDTNVNSFTITNGTLYFAGCADNIGAFAYARFVLTTTAATNTVNLTINRKAL